MSVPMIEKDKKIYKNKKVRKKFTKKSLIKAILYKIMGFLLAMSIPYGNFAPMGLAFMSVERGFRKGTFISLLTVISGNLFLGSKILSFKYIAAEIIYTSVLFVLEKGVKISLTTALLSALVSIFISGMTVMYWQGITLFSVSMLALELLITAAGVLVLDKFKSIDFKNKNFLNTITTDEKISVAIVGGLILCGFKSIYLLSSISVMNIASAVLILIIGISTNSAVAASCGVMIGFICGIETDYFLPLIGAFGFCGFLTGLFSKFGKGGSAAGLILANAVLVVYTNNAIEPMLKIYEIFISTALFLFVPEKFINDARRVFESNSISKESIIRIKEGVKIKLKSMSESFGAMSLALENLSDRQSGIEFSDIGIMFDSVADKICRNCKKAPGCWGKSFNATYRALFNIFEKMEKRGEIDKSEVGEYIERHCIHIDKLLAELSLQFDIYNVKRIWKNRLKESRELAGQQLYGVSKIIENMVFELDERMESFPSGSRIRSELQNNGFKVKEVNVDCDIHGKIKIGLNIKSVFLKKYGDIKIKNIISKLCGKEMELKITGIGSGKYSFLSFKEKERYFVEPGIAVASISGESGDNYCFIKLGCGKYVIVLSDGMGTGEIASKESKAIIELLNSFLSAGFDKTVALKLINSVMIMKSEKQAFVTIDMCIIDLYTGEVEFIKTGAEPSFIGYDKNVEIISSASLPAGIVSEAEPEIILKSASEGATIVMITDGVESREKGASWIKGYMETQKNYQKSDELAKGILDRAVEENGGKIIDDMTVISVKLHKKAS